MRQAFFFYCIMIYGRIITIMKFNKYAFGSVLKINFTFLSKKCEVIILCNEKRFV
jgi:hypothetical protein